MKLIWTERLLGDEETLLRRAYSHADSVATFHGNYEFDPRQSDGHRLILNMLRHENTNYDVLADRASTPDEYLKLCWDFVSLVRSDHPWLDQSATAWARSKKNDVDREEAMTAAARLQGKWWALTDDELKARRQERSAKSSAAIQSGSFAAGSIVKCWYGERFGLVTKVNKVTVKVRHIGGKKDNYAMVEKNYQSDLVGIHSDPVTDLVGSEMSLLDWQGKDRVAAVVEQDGPFLLVRYAIKSGETREVWTDLGRVSPMIMVE